MKQHTDALGSIGKENIMKKYLIMTLIMLLIVGTFCSCGENGDGEAGDRGNVQTNDTGDGGMDMDDSLDRDESQDIDVDDEADDRLKTRNSNAGNAMENGMDDMGNAIGNGMNDVGNAVDDMLTDGNNNNRTNK